VHCRYVPLTVTIRECAQHMVRCHRPTCGLEPALAAESGMWRLVGPLQRFPELPAERTVREAETLLLNEVPPRPGRGAGHVAGFTRMLNGSTRISTPI
jgi:hypothetical protein